MKTLNSLPDAPRPRAGQKVKLIQVTGNATINGYVPLDIFFDTTDGPVKMSVEAYVVKGMSTPFILGNDFATSYSISLLRQGGETRVQLGDSGRFIQAQDTMSPDGPRDEGGHAFQVQVRQSRLSAGDRSEARRLRAQHSRRREPRDTRVKAAITCTLAAGTSRKIPVTLRFPSDSDCAYVERLLEAPTGDGTFFGAPDSLLSREDPFLHVSNLTDRPVTIRQYQVLGHSRHPRAWLDKVGSYSDEQQKNIIAHASLIRQLAQEADSRHGATVRADPVELKAAQRVSGIDDPQAEPPLEGGPKTSEAPPEDVPGDALLSTVDISSELDETQRRRLATVVLRNSTAFSINGKLGSVQSECSIPLRPGAKEVSLPPFPSSPAKREVMDKQMDAWIELGVIEPSISPWGAPGFIVYRNGKPRMVIDYRKLNDLTIPDEFPLPRQEDIMAALSGAQWLSTMDALAGFTQVLIREEDRPKTAFRTHRGLYQFRRMPFGLRNGPSIFQRIMQTVLAPYLWVFSLVYIDDIVVYSRTFDEHVSHLDAVLKAVATAGITLSPGKCHLGYHSLMLLGQKVSRLGLSTNKDIVDAISELAPPKNVNELYTFLGMMVYFSSYIPFYAWIAAPLFALLKKGHDWRWESVHQEAFELCKQVLVQAPVRAHPTPGKPYRVYSDACDYGLAAILQQVQPIKIRDLRGTKVYERLLKAHQQGEPVPRLVTQLGKDIDDVPNPGPWAVDFEDTEVHIERVVAYWSRILKTAERNYSPTEREALALREGLIKFQPLIEGERILAVTDHAALTWSRTYQNVNRRLQTWGTTFAAYPELTIVHRAGRVHSNVDPISRLRRRVPLQDGPAHVDQGEKTLTIGEQANDPLRNTLDELGPRFEERLLKVAGQHARNLVDEKQGGVLEVRQTLDTDASISFAYAAAGTSALMVGLSDEERQVWIDGYSADDHYREVGAILRAEDPEDRATSRYPHYHLGQNVGLIYFEDWNGASRLCVPESLRLEVMKEAHDTITEGAHSGYHRTYNRVASTYYWPRMSRDIKKYVSTCDICQKAKPRRHAPVGLLQPIAIPSRPFEVVTMDFIPELPKSSGFDNCLVIVDKLTKYGMFIPTTTKITAEGTAQMFFHHVVAHYGLPRQVITDRDPRWSAEFWEQLCKHMGMRRALTTSHHPQADGQSEILNQTLEISLRAYVSAARDDWSSHLDALMLSYNSTPHTATGFAPAYLLRGYMPTTASTILHEPAPIKRPPPRRAAGGGRSGTTEQLSGQQLADEMAEQFAADRHKAQQALALGQSYQKKAYNQGRIQYEFQEGDLVLINPHSLELLRKQKGRGRKLLMKYDGPFEVMKKVSPVAYRLRFPVSYGIHPVLNIAHLERYQPSPPEYGERPKKRLNRADFEENPEMEVEKIIDERWVSGNKGRRIKQYRIRYVGLGADEDDWKTKQGLRNAPDILADWEMRPRNDSKGELTLERQVTGADMNAKQLGKLTVHASEGNPATRAVRRPPMTPPLVAAQHPVGGARRSGRIAEQRGRHERALEASTVART